MFNELYCDKIVLIIMLKPNKLKLNKTNLFL